jgi:hypothetical protein
MGRLKYLLGLSVTMSGSVSDRESVNVAIGHLRWQRIGVVGFVVGHGGR